MKVVTGKVRASYVNVFQTKYNDLKGKDEYSMQLLIPKSDKETVKRIKEAIQDSVKKKWGEKPPKSLKFTFRDGDKEEDLAEDVKVGDEPYAGHYFMNVSSKDKPGVVDRRTNPIIEPTDFQSGDYCMVSLNSYAFDTKGNKGVSFGLMNIQVVEKGEPLGNRSRPEDDFKAFEDEEEAEGLEDIL